ncbi:MAG TPA: ATP-binding protein [Candidatus Sulfotelmatobacter sp.]|jgi:two-component system OmpR family sensor kinase|nr:ATP-binding protein [Candidatus Sulfotelmatobacter sp.]
MLLWIALLLVLILAALDFAAFKIYFANSVAKFDGTLRRRVAEMSVAVFAHGNRNNDSPDAEPGKSDLDKAFLIATAQHLGQVGMEGFYFAAWSGPSVNESANRPDEIPRPQLKDRDTGTYARMRGTFREMYHATENGDLILVGHTLAPEISDANRFAGWLVFGSIVFLGLALSGSWLIIGQALQPVEKIGLTARRIADGNLSERINTEETESELGQLAGVLNSTFARLETAFAQQKQFTADAAHELRTPLAVLITEAQTTLARERGMTDYKDSISASLETVQQMRRLTDSLLELARFDAGQESLRREKVNLATLAEDSLKLVRPLAAQRNLQIRSDLEPMYVFADAGRLSQVVTNFLTNAVRYNRENGEIRIATRLQGDFAVLSVTDTGEGISPADLPRVFERFYRGDKSRSTGGNGLGLSISKAIVEAHGGTIEVASEKGNGTTFTLRLPFRPD